MAKYFIHWTKIVESEYEADSQDEAINMAEQDMENDEFYIYKLDNDGNMIEEEVK